MPRLAEAELAATIMQDNGDTQYVWTGQAHGRTATATTLDADLAVFVRPFRREHWQGVELVNGDGDVLASDQVRR